MNRRKFLELSAAGAARVTVVDRSGMGVTRDVMEAKGVFAQGKKLGFVAVVLDELPARDWIAHRLPDRRTAWAPWPSTGQTATTT